LGSSASLAEISAFISGEREESRKERLEFEARLEKQMQATLKQQEEVGRVKAQAAEAEGKLRDQQTAALQSRFQTLHTSKLLSDEELYRLEDLVFDSCEAQGSSAAAAGASQVTSMIALSERAQANEAFARQLRRKFV